MPDELFAVQWWDRLAVIAVQQHIDVATAGALRDQLPSVINRRPAVVIADMTGTASCDHAGVDAHALGYQRATASGAQLRLVVPDPGAGYIRAPRARKMADRARLVGVHKDGATLPSEISLSPVPTATGNFILAVIRDATEGRNRDDLADLAQATAAQPAQRGNELLDRVVHNLLEVGLTLQAAADLPGDVARKRIGIALEALDDTIHEIRDHAFDEPPSESGRGP